MAGFYSRLSYSFGNEDWQTEQKALKITPSDHVLCVTASGDRPLHLLQSGPQKLTSIDMNPIQNALLDLKVEALRKFDFEKYLAFLGATPTAHRNTLFQEIVPNLSADSLSYWKHHHKAIGEGVLFQGAIEKWCARLSLMIRAVVGKKPRHLFSFDDLEEQRAFIDQNWNHPFWRQCVHLILRPSLSRFFVKDPGLYAHVDQKWSVGTYIYDRFSGYLYNNLAKKSLLASFVINGRVTEEAFPPYLQKEGVKTIKTHLDRLNFQTIDLLQFLKNTEPNSIDCFSLSDVASYISVKEFQTLSKLMYRAAKPNARFCVRQFLSDHPIPEAERPHFKRNTKLEKELEEEDSCFVYRFMVGTIEK